MMKASLDSSAFAKRFVNEEGSDAVEALYAEADELGLSVICVPEIVSALNRRLRERMLTQTQYREARQRLLDDVRDAEIVQLTPAVLGLPSRSWRRALFGLWTPYISLAPLHGALMYLCLLTRDSWRRQDGLD